MLGNKGRGGRNTTAEMNCGSSVRKTELRGIVALGGGKTKNTSDPEACAASQKHYRPAALREGRKELKPKPPPPPGGRETERSF